MGGWIFPQFMYKDIDISGLDIGMLVYYHDNLHILWSKLEEGYHFEWTFLEIYKLHYTIVKQMKNKGVNHLAPINDLDKTHYYTDLQQVLAYSVEKQMNGFSVTIHKKGEEVKIFSEEKKDITISFPTLTESIKKLSDFDFVIDGELVSYDEKGKTLRNELIKYAEKEGLDDKNIKLYVSDIIYYNKPIDDLSLKRRLEFLKKLKFNERVLEIERTLISDKEGLKKAIAWASSLENSEGTVVKDLNTSYSFGEDKSWIKYLKLTPLVVSVLKRIPKKRGVHNYLVGTEADKKSLDKEYIQDGKLVLGHTFNTEQVFEVGDRIKILVEEIWKHEKKSGIHYSIHKPRVDKKTDEAIFIVDDLEDVMSSIGKVVREIDLLK